MAPFEKLAAYSAEYRGSEATVELRVLGPTIIRKAGYGEFLAMGDVEGVTGDDLLVRHFHGIATTLYDPATNEPVFPLTQQGLDVFAQLDVTLVHEWMLAISDALRLTPPKS